jgi:RsiW-degrading membrane proteinase PrsW (M82 family)
MPATVMVFFWEFNQAKNVSFFDVVRIFFIGGALSILLTFIVSAITDQLHTANSGGFGTALADAVLIGFTEELAKLVVIFVLVRKLYGCLVSNGLLVGAVVGTGFAVFETMGYGTMGWVTGSLEWTLFIRGVLSVGGHVVWSAICGAAIMLAQRPGSALPSLNTMDWGKLLALFAVPMVLHTVWDLVAFTVASEVTSLSLMAGFTVIAWVFIVRLINSGLRQYARLLRQAH